MADDMGGLGGGSLVKFYLTYLTYLAYLAYLAEDYYFDFIDGLVI
jgi:hypothetical protein